MDYKKEIEKADKNIEKYERQYKWSVTAAIVCFIIIIVLLAILSQLNV